jgi:hypothetical protein
MPGYGADRMPDNLFNKNKYLYEYVATGLSPKTDSRRRAGVNPLFCIIIFVADRRRCAVRWPVR